MRKRLFFLLVLFAGISLIPPLEATSVRVLNLEEMVEMADRVFRGRCLSVRSVAGVHGFDAVEYTFEISEGVKGTRTGRQVVFRQLQTARDGLRGIPGMPAFEQGQDLLVFLHGDSRLGLTSPVGFSQGVFRVQDTAEGPQVVNGLNNRNLMYGEVSPASIGKLTARESALLSQGGRIPLQTLTAAIRKIDRAQADGSRSNQ